MEALLKRWTKLFLVALLFFGAITFLIAIGDLVQVLIISALLSYIFDPLVTSIEARGFSRTPATVLLFAAMTAVIGFLAIWLMPLMATEINDITSGIDPRETAVIIDRLDLQLRQALAALGLDRLNLAGRLAEKSVEFGSTLINNALGLFSILTNVILIPFVVFFFLRDGRAIKKSLVSLVPNRYFELTCNLLYKMDVQLGNYLRGQILDAAIIGVLSTIALFLLDVKYAIMIGSFAGIANIIPYIGPITGAIVAIAISLVETGDLLKVAYIALAFGGVQLIDNVLVQPNVVARNVNLHPLVVLLVVIIGGKFFGILGMILSVPATAVVKVFSTEGVRIYRQYRFS